MEYVVRELEEDKDGKRMDRQREQRHKANIDSTCFVAAMLSLRHIYARH